MAGFFTTPRKIVEYFLLVETKDPLGWLTNGKAIFQVTIGFKGLKYGIPSDPKRKPLSFGQFGIMWWQ